MVLPCDITICQAGNLYESYDSVTSTEGFYAGVDNSSLKFVSPAKDPPKIKDNVSQVIFHSNILHNARANSSSRVEGAYT